MLAMKIHHCNACYMFFSAEKLFKLLAQKDSSDFDAMCSVFTQRSTSNVQYFNFLLSPPPPPARRFEQTCVFWEYFQEMYLFAPFQNWLGTTALYDYTEYFAKMVNWNSLESFTVWPCACSNFKGLQVPARIWQLSKTINSWGLIVTLFGWIKNIAKVWWIINCWKKDTV